ncbi:MAG: SCP2 sterol-binding domain-containing protein [bacterium]
MRKEEYENYNLRLIEEAAKEPDMERKLGRYAKTLRIEISDLGAQWVMDTKEKVLKGYPAGTTPVDDVVTMDSGTWDRILSDPSMADSAATSAAMGGALRFQGDMYSHMPLLGIIYSLAKAKAKLAKE